VSVARAAIVRVGDARRAERGGGVQTSYLVTRGLGASQFLTGVTELEPGAAVPRHRHNCEESVIVLGGHAMFECGATTCRLAPGDATWVPEGVEHRFENPYDRPLRILWIYGRIDATRTLSDSGATVAIDAEGSGRT
jgi:putative monooxygenase